MPSAGAVAPPVITPLRKQVIGIPVNHIDTAIYVDLATDDLDCRLFFTSDGTKPNPFQRKIGGKEVTFKYRGPFTMRPGKRMIKAMAVSRDGLRESNIVTKTFVVDDVGPPDDDVDLESLILAKEEIMDEMYDPAPAPKKRQYMDLMHLDKEITRPKSAVLVRPKPSMNGAIVPRSKSPNPSRRTAWAVQASESHDPWPRNVVNGAPEVKNDHNAVQMPQGGSNPVNYSGTQINFWGVSGTGQLPGMPGGPYSLPGGGMNPYETRQSQLGSITEKMIQNLDQPKLTVADVKELIHDQQPAPAPPPAIEYPVRTDPEAKQRSPGKGDWHGQVEHVYAHLLELCKNEGGLRSAIGAPIMGPMLTADFDVEEDAYIISMSFARPGVRPKPKPKPVPESPPPKRTPPPPKIQPPPPKPVVRAPPPKPAPKVEAKKANEKKSAVQPKPKPKPKPKEPEPKPKEDPYFETEEYEAEGTLKLWPYFNAEADCEALRAAMKGMGTDEASIINILPYRNSVQRQEILTMYKTMFGKDLKEELESENSGDFKEILSALCMGAADYDAYEIHKAIKGLGTDDDCLIEILCTRTNVQIKAMKEAYKKLYLKDMEKDVKDDTSGHFKKLLVAQMSGSRSEDPTFDRTAAKNDAQALYQAGEKKWGTDESTFNTILCTRSFPYLRAVFEEYGKLSKDDIEEVIKSEFSGDIKNGLLTVVRVIKDKVAYFATKIQKTMKGMGTEDSALIRVIVSRCEGDMVQIKASFETLFNGTLADWIRDDTSGDYSEVLLALIGDRAAPAPSAEEIEEAQAEPEIEEVEEENLPQDPTLKPSEPFDPKKDCEVLKKAMKGFGTDEDAIIGVWGHRSNEQRQELINQYKTLFGKDLIKELKSELGGKLKQTVIALCDKPDAYDANELRKAMKGLGTDEEALIEILCTRDNEQIQALQAAYTHVHNRKLEDDIISETSGNIKRLLVSMVQGSRPGGNTVDRRKARKDAKDMLEAGEGKKWGTDESRFNVILCARSYPQLRATFEEYKKLANKEVEEAIESEMSGDLKKGMLTIVGCIRNKAAQFAKRIYESMKGLGTDDDTLIRVTVSRCEVDMVQIAQEFKQRYDDDLAKYVADDTSGDYRKILLALLNGEQFLKK